MEVESFEQARALGRDELSRLLASDRPEQRLWAIWALALLLGDGAGDFAHRIVDEPDPGVRRHLAVMLAGHGELDLLLELVREDRSPVVRESTIALLARLAAGSPSDPRSKQMRAILEGAEHGPPAILIALLGAIGKGAPEYQIAIARRSLDSGNREIQLEAFETLLRIDLPSTVEPAREWFCKLPNLPDHIDRWLRASEVHSLAQAISVLPMATRGGVLAKLRAPPWPAVELLVGNDLELLRTLLTRVDVSIPATALAGAVLRGADHGFAHKLAAQLAIAADGRSLLADLRAAIETSDPEDSIRELAFRVRQFGDAIEIAEREELFAEVADHHPVEQLMALEHAVARWITERDAPPALLPMLAELEEHCAQRLLMLRAAGHDRKPAGRRPQLGNQGTRPFDNYARYQDLFDLQTAIERLTNAR
jgi:hypothetical protein